MDSLIVVQVFDKAARPTAQILLFKVALEPFKKVGWVMVFKSCQQLTQPDSAAMSQQPAIT